MLNDNIVLVVDRSELTKAISTILPTSAAFIDAII